MIDTGTHGFGGFEAVCRNDDGHIGDGAHDRKVLGAMVGSTCRTEAQSAVRRDDFDGKVLVSDVGADLFASAQTRENRKRRSKGDQPRFGKTRRNAEQVLLGNPDVEDPFGELVAEQSDVGRFGKVGGYAHDTGIGCAQFCQYTSVNFFGRHFVCVICGPSGSFCHLSRPPYCIASMSRLASAARSLFIAP